MRQQLLELTAPLTNHPHATLATLSCCAMLFALLAAALALRSDRSKIVKKVKEVVKALPVIIAFSLMCALSVLCGCSMSMGKIVEYQDDGKTIKRTEETRKNASTMQTLLTTLGIRVKMIAPAGSDMAPVEFDLGLIRIAQNITPLGEKSYITTDAEGIFPWSGNKLHHVMSTNIDPSLIPDSGVTEQH